MLVRQHCKILVAVTGLALWPAAVQAQQPNAPPAPVLTGVPAAMSIPFAPPGPPFWLAKFPANSVIPGSPYAPPPSGYTPPPPLKVPPPNNPRLYQVGMGCWSHHDRPTCSSLQSSLKFIFSSCHTFFGEPCMQKAPAVPVPNGVGFRTNPHP